MNFARDLLSFIDASPSPYHATLEIVRRLQAREFLPLLERDMWELRPGDKRFVVREASVIAFVVGSEPVADAGFSIVGAHTDSPCLRVKPNPSHAKHGYALLGCEIYGGALYSTWMDRDLGLAGRVTLRGKKTTRTALVRFTEPILRIPNLAIHLHRDVNKDGLKLNPQTQMVPVIALAQKHALDVRELVAGKIDCKAGDIVGFDLCLASTEPSVLGGVNEEFIFAPRLDNLASCHAGISALLSAPRKHVQTRAVVCYDHEEIGSLSSHGAQSPFLRDVLERVTVANGGDAQSFARARAHSFCISADMAHAVHPNYAELSEAEHMPVLGKGPVVKTNANQRYATCGDTAARFLLACERAKVNVQKFVMRNDLACGSTIGPITAGELGVPTVDVGNPMLSMHSIREMAATGDVGDMIAAMTEFFSG